MVEALRPNPAGAPLGHAERRLAQLSLDYALDSIELSRDGGDIIDRLLVAAILDANLAPVKQDAKLDLAYAALDDPPPETVLRPISINGVAHSLRLPYETIRRRVARLASQGVVVLGPSGVLVTQRRLESQAFKALSLARYERLRRFHRDLVEAQALPRLSHAAGAMALATTGGPEPVRAANRILAEYLLRSIDAITRRVGHPLDGLILLHLARANFQGVGQRPRPAPVRIATLAQRLALPSETVRRRLRTMEQVGVCRRSRTGVVLAARIVAHPGALALLQENEANVDRMFARLERLGLLGAWRAERPDEEGRGELS